MFDEKILMTQKKIIVYGAGNFGKRLQKILKTKDKNIWAFCETEVKTSIVNDVQVISIMDLEKLNGNEFIVLIAIDNKKISEELVSNVKNINANMETYEVGEYIRNNVASVGINEKLNYRRYEDMHRVLSKNFYSLPNVDYIVGIPRSGMIPAIQLGLLLNKPVISLNEFLHTDYKTLSLKYTQRIPDKKRDADSVLVIDDSCCTGLRINEAKQEIDKNCKDKDINIIYASVYVTSESKNYVDYYFEICELPRFFEWNVMNHSILQDCAIDMDGVLCVDPNEDQNDDSKKYIDFIKSAMTLYSPKYDVGAIVTSRLEKYRKNTEEWLSNKNIKYKQLKMIDLPDKSARIRFKAHATFKAEIYLKNDYKLFIESNPIQAKRICELTNKPVLCTENMKLYEGIDGMEWYENRRIENDSVKKEALVLLDKLEDTKKDIMNDDSVDLFSENIYKLNELLHRYSLTNENWEAVDDIEKSIKNRRGKELLEYVKEIDLYDVKMKVIGGFNNIMIDFAQCVSNEDWAKEHNFVLEMLGSILEGEYESNMFEDEIKYIKNKKRLMLYPYEFEEKYNPKSIEVEFDDDNNLIFVNHLGKKLFFPKKDENEVREEYNLLRLEQDINCPHNYFDENIKVDNGDIFVDVGAAEGVISLNNVEKASEIYLIECDEKRIKALERTFSKYKEKVHIINKYAGLEDSSNSIRLDTLLKQYAGRNIVIKMDVEGMELEVLEGAKKTLQNNNCKLSCTTYHTNNASKEMAEFFNKCGYVNYFSKGYMLFYYGYMVMKNGKYKRLQQPYFRKAIIRAYKTI